MKWNMRMKILAVCVCCTLIALVMQTFLFQRASAKLISRQSKNESYHTLENMQNEIYTFIKNIESNMIEIYNNREFLSSLKSGENVEDIRKKYYRLAYTIAAEEFQTSDDTSMLISSYYNVHRKRDIARFELKIYDNTNLSDKVGYIIL